MQKIFEPRLFISAQKYSLSENTAVQTPIQQHILPKVPNNGLKCRLPGFNQLMRYLVRINHRDTFLGEKIGNRALSTGNAACNAYFEHLISQGELIHPR
jgi:hypothetical protein